MTMFVEITNLTAIYLMYVFFISMFFLLLACIWHVPGYASTKARRQLMIIHF